MVSVIIPSFNRAPLLKKAIASVLCQTYKDLELIVVDDGSEDVTPEVVSGFGSDIVYVRQDNKGPACARNTGIKKARGEFIAFLDSDDWWDRDKLSVQMCQMRENPEYLISHTDEVWYRRGMVLKQKKKHRKIKGYIFDKCLSLCVVSMSTVVMHKAIFSKIGLFDERFPCCEDYDFWLRLSVDTPVFFIKKALTLKDGGRPDQLSFIYRVGIDKFRIHSIKKVLEGGALDARQRWLALQELQKKCDIYGKGCLKYGKIEEGRYYLGLPKRYKEI